jgi:hypothetical protein
LGTFQNVRQQAAQHPNGESVMKKFVFALMFVMLFVTAALAFGSAFCDGWEDGYVAGYCYRQIYGCIQPIVPICPIPRIGEDSYQDGYNGGFLAGLNAQR